jgi:hypothetical protein
VLEPRRAEAGFLEPVAAVGSCIVEAARRLDQSVQAYQQAKGILAPLVVDQSLPIKPAAPSDALRRRGARHAGVSKGVEETISHRAVRRHGSWWFVVLSLCGCFDEAPCFGNRSSSRSPPDGRAQNLFEPVVGDGEWIDAHAPGDGPIRQQQAFTPLHEFLKAGESHTVSIHHGRKSD